MENIIGLTSSLAYIFFVIGIATVVAKKSQGASETSRKVVHILVGNWVFLTPLFTELVIVPHLRFRWHDHGLLRRLLPRVLLNQMVKRTNLVESVSDLPVGFNVSHTRQTTKHPFTLNLCNFSIML